MLRTRYSRNIRESVRIERWSGCPGEAFALADRGDDAVVVVALADRADADSAGDDGHGDDDPKGIVSRGSPGATGNAGVKVFSLVWRTRREGDADRLTENGRGRGQNGRRGHFGGDGTIGTPCEKKDSQKGRDGDDEHFRK